MSVQEIINRLPTLSQSDLSKVRVVLQGLGSAQDLDDRIEGETLVYHLLKQRLEDYGLSPPPYVAFRRTRHFTKFREGAKVALAYVAKFLKPKGPVEFRKGLTITLRSLTGRLERDGVEVSLGACAVNLYRVPAIMDEMFPGYRESGMLRSVIDNWDRQE